MDNVQALDRDKMIKTALNTISTPDVFRRVDHIINKSYLPMLQQFPIIELKDKELMESTDCACFFPIKRIVFDKEENNLQKLTSVYTSLAGLDGCISMIIRGYEDGETEILLGICDQKAARINGAFPKTKAFQNSLFGNFPGCRNNQNRVLNCEETRIAFNTAFSSEYNTVASVSCIGSRRGKNQGEKNNEYYQGIEKVIEAMSGKRYTILILAQPVSSNDIQSMRSELEELYTNLSMFSKMSLSVNQAEAHTVSDSVTHTLSDSITKTQSKSLSVGENTSESVSYGIFESTSSGVSAGVAGIGSSLSSSYGSNNGHSSSKGKQKNWTDGSTEGVTKGKSSGNTSGESLSETQGKTIQLSIENKKISEALNCISQQLQRIKNGSGMGLFATSAYFLSDSYADVRTVSSLYKAVVSGDSTSIEYNGINIWSGEEFKQIFKYLRHFLHPRFELSAPTEDAVSMTATPATVVTSAELAIQMGLPQHSVDGISVKEAVPFGRNIVRLADYSRDRSEVFLGNIYHLGIPTVKKAHLDIDSLTMHTFVTGTTGSGKSNTVYGLIDSVCAMRENVHFMVIEPAKGEYKAVFGDRDDVSVYGTNPYVTKLLRINPFKFSPEIHILEHIDRLVGLFNVCWPMEAAMPAVLKQSIEKAYISAGWNLKTSRNNVSANLYPDFGDIMDEVNRFIDYSDYSDENKGNYKGALCTRLRELTTGLNGMIFVPDEIPESDLFDKNVIIDLSRVGSAETKSLIMGLMIIKMQEYRQSTHSQPNSKLNHITVLEEAHNILKRTSTEQSMDSANIVGKSVEMISNALAEMRSYGEGFIIADQSPEQVDLSVIRNTNTKIVMRLPSYEDRKLVGKAASLNDAQIDELSKLPTGVAAVYQNDWMESVLVQMPYYSQSNNIYKNQPDEDTSIFGDADKQSLLYAIMGNSAGIDAMIDSLGVDAVERISLMHIPTRVKRQLIDYIRDVDGEKIDKLGKIAFEFFNFQEAMEFSCKDESIEVWKENVLELLDPSVSQFDDRDKDTLLLIIGHEYALRERAFRPMYIKLANMLV